jgi:hypothetical protein
VPCHHSITGEHSKTGVERPSPYYSIRIGLLKLITTENDEPEATRFIVSLRDVAFSTEKNGPTSTRNGRVSLSRGIHEKSDTPTFIEEDVPLCSEVHETR